jgi:hypothetical protein
MVRFGGSQLASIGDVILHNTVSPHRSRAQRTAGVSSVTRPHLIAMIALAGLCACGVNVVNAPGGAPPLSSAPGEVAFVDYLRNAHRYTLNATDRSGNTYIVLFNSEPNALATTFNGAAPAYSTVDTLTLKLEGVFGGTLTNTIATNYYLLNPYVPLGKTFTTGAPYGLTTSSTPLPTTFTVGNTGSIYSLTYYHDSTMAVIDGDETATYSVYAVDSKTLKVCLSFVLSDVTLVGGSDGLVPGPEETDCYSEGASGAMGLISVAIMVSTDETLDFT